MGDSNSRWPGPASMPECGPECGTGRKEKIHNADERLSTIRHEIDAVEAIVRGGWLRASVVVSLLMRDSPGSASLYLLLK